MKTEFKRIGLFLKPSPIDDFSNIINNLIRWLSKRDKIILFSSEEKERILSSINPNLVELISFTSEKELYTKIDLAISLGGDGTLLGITRNINTEVPLFGVNLGHLGFITEFRKSEFYEKLNAIFAGVFKTEEKTLYAVDIGDEIHYFFNDIVFGKNNIARMFKLCIQANNEHIYNLSGDGLIISSTTGSTAYSLAAGGPLVHPKVKAFILTPICPHSLTHRPIVLPDSTEIEIQLLDDSSDAIMTIDGQIMLPINKLTKIKLAPTKNKKIIMISNGDRTYFQTLKEKLIHGRQPL